MSDSERTQQIKDMIRRHLEEVGTTRWRAVRLHCSDISDATFWRYVKAVREEIAEKPGPSAPTNRSAGQAWDDEVPCLGALPGFYNSLQKARLYELLLADAETMRGQAVDHRGKITNWRMFEKSIQLRERLVSQQGEVMGFFQAKKVGTSSSDRSLKSWMNCRETSLPSSWNDCMGFSSNGWRRGSKSSVTPVANPIWIQGRTLIDRVNFLSNR